MIYWVLTVLMAALAYSLGNLRSTVIASNFIFHANIRKLGEGNVALSNFRRIYGVKGALKLLLVEVLIDLLPILISGWLFGIKDHAIVGRAFAGFCLLMGRLFPVLYKLKGRSGVVPLVTMAFCVDISIGVVVLAVVIAMIMLRRYLALAAMIGGVTLAILAILLVDDRIAMLLCIFAGLILVVKHFSALFRISAGKEVKISFEEDISYKFDEKF